MSIFGKRQGNVVTIFTSVATGQPLAITSFEDPGPVDGFPMTLSLQEAKFKYPEIQLFEEVRPVVPVAPGVDATAEDVAKFFQENAVNVPVQTTPAPVQQEFVQKLKETKNEHMPEFIDSCIKRAIQNEIETYELAEKYASGKKAKEITIIIKALKDFMDRIENGKKN